MGRRDADFLIGLGPVSGCTEVSRYHFARCCRPEMAWSFNGHVEEICAERIQAKK